MKKATLKKELNRLSKRTLLEFIVDIAGDQKKDREVILKACKIKEINILVKKHKKAPIPKTRAEYEAICSLESKIEKMATEMGVDLITEPAR